MSELAHIPTVDTDQVSGIITKLDWKVRDIPNANYTSAGWSVEFKETEDAEYEMGFWLEQPIDTSWAPELGQDITVWGFGQGLPVRGVEIDGDTIFYYTPDQQNLMLKREALYRSIDLINKTLEGIGQDYSLQLKEPH